MFHADRHNFKKFNERIWLSSPTMHGEELEYIKEAYETNWMSTVGENINEIEKKVCEYTGCAYAVALSSGTAALHMALKLAGEDIYGNNYHKADNSAGILSGHRVFCSDVTFAATVNPILYENGIPVFIDMEYDTWNMSPKALIKAFDKYPEVRIVVTAHLYGTPAHIKEIAEICERHNAVLIEDAAESFGALYMGIQTGNYGKYNIISFNGNKIITGSSGGMLLTNDENAAIRVRKWSTQSRDPAPWYQHTETGYNYRMSNVIAGVVRGQLPYLHDHISGKRIIWERYREAFKGLPIKMNPVDIETGNPNYWLSCILIDESAMCSFTRHDDSIEYISSPGKTCPAEILDVLSSINAEGRPIWKPMHMQPVFKGNDYICADFMKNGLSAGNDIFNRGLCLPSDIKMTSEQQDIITDVVKACFE